MLEAFHLNAGAARRLHLVIDGRDGFDLIDRLVEAFGGRLLAYCLMHTHVHVVVEGPLEENRRRMSAALWAYTQSFNKRHGFDGRLLRGPVAANVIPGPYELGRAISYVHDNPTTCKPPIVERAIHYEWSSARLHAEFSRATFANVARARELLGAELVRRKRPPLADLEAEPLPLFHPPLILAAAAQTYGLGPDHLVSMSRAPAATAARAVFVALGRLESYTDAQLAPFLRRTRQRVTQIASDPIDEGAARIARTLLRNEPFRRRLERWVPASAAGSRAAAPRVTVPT